MTAKFKTHNTLGKPLCLCCGHNPRKPDRLKCGRCEREMRAVRWSRLEPTASDEAMRILSERGTHTQPGR